MSVSPEELREGMAVRASDGRKLGRIVLVDGDRIHFERGFFWPREFVARSQEVASIDRNGVVLSPGARLEGDEAETALAPSPPEEEWTDASQELRVPVTEEQLEVSKHVTVPTRVRIHREVHTEMRQISVPITREVLRIEHVPIDMADESAVGEDVFSEHCFEIPLREEQVMIQKRPVVREVVRVSRVAQTEERTIHEPVKRLDVTIDRTEETGSSNEPH